MKILLLSDSHGNLSGVQTAVKKYGKNADVIVHCGDSGRGEAQWLIENCSDDRKVICVCGNCDFSSALGYTEFLEAAGHKILITHGHHYSVKYGLEKLSYAAEEEGCDMAFYGHTHIANDETLGCVRMINPGSAGRYGGTCAVVELDEKGNVLVNHVRLPKTPMF